MFGFVSNLLAGLGNVESTAGQLTDTITNVAVGLFGLAVLGMVGLSIFLAYKMFTASDDSKRKDAKGQLIYAVIGVAVLVLLLVLTPIIKSAIESAAHGSEVKLDEFIHLVR